MISDLVPGVRWTGYSRLLVLGIAGVGLTCWVVLNCHMVSDEGVPTEADEELSQSSSAAEIDTANFTTVGKSPYFNLEPGYRLRYTDGSLTRTMTVRRKTKVVDGVPTRVVEEKEEKDGQPTKVVWKYYAINKTTSDLCCFGVHIQSYRNGKQVDDHGWCSGFNGEVFAVAIPAAPRRATP